MLHLQCEGPCTNQNDDWHSSRVKSRDSKRHTKSWSRQWLTLLERFRPRHLATHWWICSPKQSSQSSVSRGERRHKRAHTSAELVDRLAQKLPEAEAETLRYKLSDAEGKTTDRDIN